MKWLDLSGEQPRKHTRRTRQTQRHVERLAENKTGDEGARALGKALKKNTTLRGVNLYSEGGQTKNTDKGRGREK